MCTDSRMYRWEGRDERMEMMKWWWSWLVDRIGKREYNRRDVFNLIAEASRFIHTTLHYLCPPFCFRLFFVYIYTYLYFLIVCASICIYLFTHVRFEAAPSNASRARTRTCFSHLTSVHHSPDACMPSLYCLCSCLPEHCVVSCIILNVLRSVLFCVCYECDCWMGV